MTQVHFRSVKEWRAYREQQKAKLLTILEFELWMHSPDVFTSYRAARKWAFETLEANPGQFDGFHDISWDVNLIKCDDGYECSVSQYCWSADHCGAVKRTGAQAIVQAVLELKAGY